MECPSTTPSLYLILTRDFSNILNFNNISTDSTFSILLSLESCEVSAVFSDTAVFLGILFLNSKYNEAKKYIVIFIQARI